MIYRFKSQAAADVIMLEPNGRQILELIGKEPGPQGIVTRDQIPAAIQALESAVAQEKTSMHATTAESDAPEADVAHSDHVSLAQRAAPFIDLLQRSAAEGRDVIWGV
jgi:uncharacterized protein DUF1840